MKKIFPVKENLLMSPLSGFCVHKKRERLIMGILERNLTCTKSKRVCMSAEEMSSLQKF
jgi:hypothetical protein